ncbi:MAG: DUF1501 domain-containing protein [Verrucomicrobiota bacterium]
MNRTLSRRKFLGEAACAAVTATPLISTLLNLSMTNAMAATSIPSTSITDYKALVCILLAGGNDSFNMLVPRGNSEYNEYQTVRSSLSLAQNSLHALNGTFGGKSLGLHAGMPELASLFNSGDAAFLANVGTLVEPTTLANYNNGTVRLPLGLFSHSDQIMHWQTSVPDSRSARGWGGRVADILNSVNTNARISMNISLAGTNTFQSGNETVSYEILPTGNGAVQPDFMSEEPSAYSAIARTGVRSLIDAQYQNLFQETFARTNASAIDASGEFATAISGQTLTTTFSASQLSQAMQMVARTIAARDTLGMRRQTFFVLMGGYDHHDELINNHAAMLPVVSRALAEFNAAMKELNVHNNVTTFTASDFARTLTSNGRGSDHGWGGNQIVMGGAVNGGLVYGNYPDLGLGNSLDTGRGRLIPTLSTDEYFAELAQWFGVSNSCLGDLFPNLNRFYNIGATAPIGFLNQNA